VNTNYSYDNLSRLTSILHQVGSTTLDGASYTYDAAGNRLSRQTSNASVTSKIIHTMTLSAYGGNAGGYYTHGELHL